MEGLPELIWKLSNRADPVAVAIADRHYNRQKVGTPQFVPPGRCLVLLAEDVTKASICRANGYDTPSPQRCGSGNHQPSA
jgi:hypothetical protein